MKASIRPHMTLARLQARITPPLVGNNVASQADGVLIFTSTSSVTYFLRSDGVTWRKAGSTTDFSGMIIPPDQSIMLQMRSGAKELRQEGLIRNNSFRMNMRAGVQAAATGFPDSLSPVEFGATTNLLAPQLTTWVGSNQQSLADGILVFDPSKGSFVTYYLRADGITWRASGSTVDLSANKFLKPDSIIMLKRRNAEATKCGSRSGSEPTSRAGTNSGNSPLLLTTNSNGRRSTITRFTYQSPSAVSDSGVTAAETGSNFRSFCVGRRMTMTQLYWGVRLAAYQTTATPRAGNALSLVTTSASMDRACAAMRRLNGSRCAPASWPAQWYDSV
jgi:hypothetical protein